MNETRIVLIERTSGVMASRHYAECGHLPSLDGLLTATVGQTPELVLVRLDQFGYTSCHVVGDNTVLVGVNERDLTEHTLRFAIKAAHTRVIDGVSDTQGVAALRYRQGGAL